MAYCADKIYLDEMAYPDEMTFISRELFDEVIAPLLVEQEKRKSIAAQLVAMDDDMYLRACKSISSRDAAAFNDQAVVVYNAEFAAASGKRTQAVSDARVVRILEEAECMKKEMSNKEHAATMPAARKAAYSYSCEVIILEEAAFVRTDIAPVPTEEEKRKRIGDKLFAMDDDLYLRAYKAISSRDAAFSGQTMVLYNAEFAAASAKRTQTVRDALRSHILEEAECMEKEMFDTEHTLMMTAVQETAYIHSREAITLDDCNPMLEVD